MLLTLTTGLVFMVVVLYYASIKNYMIHSQKVVIFFHCFLFKDRDYYIDSMVLYVFCLRVLKVCVVLLPKWCGREISTFISRVKEL